MGRVAGKVAFITGAARGQGRSHAVRLAEEGADIIAIDLCGPVETVPHTMATAEDLTETVSQVEALGRRILARQADVRDFAAVREALDEGVSTFGRLDIVSANAGITSVGRLEDLSEATWRDMIDINLTGVWHTVKAAIPHLKAGARGGSIVVTSSAAGVMGLERLGHYASAKHGVIGLMKSLALELAPDWIRVNALLPTMVGTDMILYDANYRALRPDLEAPTKDDVIEFYSSLNALPIPWVEPIDVSNALLFLASDEARYITGVSLPVDAGNIIR